MGILLGNQISQTHLCNQWQLCEVSLGSSYCCCCIYHNKFTGLISFYKNSLGWNCLGIETGGFIFKRKTKFPYLITNMSALVRRETGHLLMFIKVSSFCTRDKQKKISLGRQAKWPCSHRSFLLFSNIFWCLESLFPTLLAYY